VWFRLPDGVRRSRAMAVPKSVARRLLGVRPTYVPPSPAAEGGPVHEARPEPQTVVKTLAELDGALAELDALAAISDDELRRGFARFRMEVDLDLPSDPYSDAYRARVFEIYAWLHGKPYDPSHEASVFDVATAADSPFPYSTQSGQTVGNQLIAIGHIIRTLDLAPGSSVLEFGPGWGNTTVALARMGHHVTAIDVEPRFVELITTRAERVNTKVNAIVGDFALLHQLEEQYDAVLFFECFHHCADHLALLAGLDRIVRPGGRVYFAAEPITDAMPAPWGLRFDGESLWQIRKNGWLELGFRETYFLRTLERYGWKADKVVCDTTPWGVIYVARRVDMPAATPARS
jgi:2-polyprenyl-3-methyl-5-hydroxy-6-metoxy-1,4-benzoquinol methylase